MPLKMPTITRDKLNTKPDNQAEKLVEDGLICCQEFNFRLCDVDGFLFHEADQSNLGQTTVYFKGYTAFVPDSEKKLYELLFNNLTRHKVE